MNKKKIRIAELFSGIGSQYRALCNVTRDKKYREFEPELVNTCEWDIHSMLAYHLMHNNVDAEGNQMTHLDFLKKVKHDALSYNGKQTISIRSLFALNDKVLSAIGEAIEKTHNLLDITKVTGKSFRGAIDILTYSFPCQDLSNAGSIHGYNKGIAKQSGTRSSLVWEVERILKSMDREGIKKPRFLVLENVISLDSARHKEYFDEWKKTLDKLGYYNKVFKLYAPDCGIPQKRKRLIMLSVLCNDRKGLKEKLHKLLSNYEIKKIPCAKIKTFLREKYSNARIKNEAKECQIPNTASRQIIIKNNVNIKNSAGKYSELASTITTKQDRHPNSGVVYSPETKEKNKLSYRFLTPRECFLLMGYTDEDYDILASAGYLSRKNSKFFSRDILYKLAGNSIVVNMLEPIFKLILDIKNNYKI